MEEIIHHIAVVAGPGYSHLVPILEFSKQLIQIHPNLHVTSIIPTLGTPSSASKTYLQTLPPTITPIFLPPVNPTDLPIGLETAVQMKLTVTYSLPFIYEALKSLTSRDTPVVALVVDNFAYEALDFAKEFNMLSYVYFPKSALTLSLYFYLPKLDEETSCDFRYLLQPIHMPGCVPLYGHDLHKQVQDRSSQGYQMFLERSRRFCSVDGIFMNTFVEMETESIRALLTRVAPSSNPTLYPIGPIIQTGIRPKNEPNNLVITWLGQQKPKSVLYVCFGSGGTLSQEQTVELALGLEMSNNKFLWVVRAPNNVSSESAYLKEQNEDPMQFLPSGFLERNKERGLVVPSWAPQVEILRHKSIGGFMSHCGWNSTLESVVHGVPLIAWPLFAEQRMNAVLMSDGLKVALRVKEVNGNGVVEREEVAKVVKGLMESEQGGEIRQRMKELSKSAIDAIKQDGSSTKTLQQSTFKWKKYGVGIM